MSAIIDTLTATLMAAPDSWQCRLALIEALIAEARGDEAYAVLSNVTELPPDVDSCLMAAKAYGILEPETGIEILDRLIATDPTCAPAYLEKAKLCYTAGDVEMARRQYKAATTFDPTLVDPGFANLLNPGELPPPPEAEISPQNFAAAPAAPMPVSQAPQGKLDRSAVYYPAPGEFPTMTLREALAVRNIRPLVNPDSIPELPHLAYQHEVTRLGPIHTREEQYREMLHNVEVQTAHYPEPVVYDYRAPDDSIFAPVITADDIYVGALVTDTGEPVANLQESVRRNKAAKEAEIAQREKVAKIQSLVAALITLAGICVLMILAVVAVPRPSPPQIVASAVISPNDDSLETTTIKQNRITPTPTQSASAMSMEVLTVSSASNVSMMSFDSPTMDLGSASLGTNFGSSMSFGDAVGGGSVMFFGGKSSGKRFLFVLDASASMKPEQIKLRDDELEKTLKTLRNVDFQVLLFAGGAYYADKGWGLAPKQKSGKFGPEHFVSPKGDYTFKSSSLFEYELLDEKEFESPKWKKASPGEVRKTVEFVKDSKKFSGTDWDNALRIGHMMQPPPDVIFFMSDGLDNKLDINDIINNSKRNGRPKINSVAMQTAKGSDKFSGIAEKSGGSYTIVDKDGEPIDGFEFIKDPASFAGRLKF